LLINDNGIVLPEALFFTGKCFEYSNKAVQNDATLALVWGYYVCPVWDDEPQPHWWTVRPDGSICDPTAIQFPSNGAGQYEGEMFYEKGEYFA